jgi:hypothetical protein
VARGANDVTNTIYDLHHLIDPFVVIQLVQKALRRDPQREAIE